ncbi:hypothetical protein [Roseomonas genomospecies 6]|uniref:Uncharacterized protein n=1 Tax=Roseomonas genomospecies 6 TaxID=214106 RepID=A0A9W7U0X9_9PROT|nr:hypothetical protein [Roseomonas genomospecies 6]KAA0683560.1 hypothetical protein DS843_04055 [Roseomonas genomospecies 6]
MDSRVVNALAAISVAALLFLGFGGGLTSLSGNGGAASAGGGGSVQAADAGLSATVAKLEK